ncbi:MAG TPA: U32 family peptidase [Bacilli bacterium]|jgi:putative protease|nr:U32 family peptidase [Acholeplasmataceae bacterium]HNZ78210.1 U32 family peptidase [Bacilli bacterium]HOD60787.1 U32 family peptidase [Bacilli bacterium]HOH61729.1 U32 family peptidase [Bacilli bacterium]HPB49261.1 U32 family peptidase [Bacilli bacterium]
MRKQKSPVELLAPAGDLEKLKIAVLYGADAVYMGGKKFSLRARASNFTLKDIKEGCRFAHRHGAKVYVTMNIIPHEEDFTGVKQYLKSLERAKVDGIIVSSMSVAELSKEVTPSLDLHISTQLSSTNSSAVNEYQRMGFSRVVLAREVLPEDMEKIVRNTDCELEVFIHGGMCVSYSGRCMLSNHLTNRDANRGGCAHSCRWNYDLYRNGEIINDKLQFFTIGSKDLVGLKHIFRLISLGIKSLKIEGRMKSLYYIATVVRCYRLLIDDYNKTGGDESLIDWDFYLQEIAKAENRLSSTGFLAGKPTIDEQLYHSESEMPTKDFLGIVLKYDGRSKIATIEQRNYFSLGDVVEFFGPQLANTKMQISMMMNENKEPLEIARHPLQIVKIKVPFKLSPFDMMRKGD